MSTHDYVVQNIKELMERKRINQNRLASLSGLPYQSIYKILKGERTPSLATLEKLAQGLNCKVQDFFPAQEKLSVNIGRESLYELFVEALTASQNNSLFGLKSYEQRELFDLVEQFGGWSFLRDYLKEELEIRQKAEEDYKKLRQSLHAEMSYEEVSQTKNNMIISKMISESSTRNPQ